LPFTYAVYKDQRLVVSTGSGRVTCDEIRARQDETATDPDFNADFNQIVDLRAVTAFDVSVDEFRVLAARQVFSATSRRAFVAADAAIFGMGRLWEAETEFSQQTSQIRVFYDLRSALDWLDVENVPGLL
jgi:hypothetical protein